MAAKRRHWKEKDGRFWARLSIPPALRPQFDNKTQLTEPLGGDLRIADRNHAAAVARLQARIDQARQSVTTPLPSKPAVELRLPTVEDHENAVWEYYSTHLQRQETKRSEMPTPDEIAHEYELVMRRIEAGEADPARSVTGMFNVYTDHALKSGARYFDQKNRERRLVALRAALAAGETRPVDAAVREYVTCNNLLAEPGSSEWRALAHVLTRAEIEALLRTLEVDQGVFGGQPSDPIVRPPTLPREKLKPVPLKALFDEYIASRQAVGKHRDGGANWEHAIRDLIKFVGHSDARKITKRNLLDWRDALLASGKAAKTVSDKYLAAVRAVFRWAEENDRLPTNEAEKVHQDVPTKTRSREVGYTTSEAVDILRASADYQPAAVSNPSNRESAHITAAKRWVPVLCAFTGARVTEMTQLRKEDIREESGRWILRITPDAGSVKTGQYRDVPLHRQIVSLGFVDFVKSAKPGPLFHGAVSPQKYLANARVTGGRLTEWLHALKLVPDGVQPNHAWRHRLKTVGRELGLSDRVLDAIQGHAGKTSSDDYGDVTIAAKLRVIDALPDYDINPDSETTVTGKIVVDVEP